MEPEEKLHVLVVDDDASVGLVLQALLEQDGFRVSLTESARAALALLQNTPVDLLLSDLRMPGLDGQSLLQAVKHGWPELPVVMLTAHGSVPSAVAAMQAGASDFLLKPFERSQLLATLRRALQRSETERARAAIARSELRLSGTVQATERATIVRALSEARGNRTKAAQLLGVSRRTLYNKLTEHGLL